MNDLKNASLRSIKFNIIILLYFFLISAVLSPTLTPFQPKDRNRCTHNASTLNPLCEAALAVQFHSKFIQNPETSIRFTLRQK